MPAGLRSLGGYVYICICMYVYIHTYIHTYVHIVAAIGNKAYLRYARVPKMTYLHGKIDLLIRQKRPSNIGLPEVCVSVKRALFAWQKRPIIHAKEA